MEAIENELESIISKDKKNWVRIYELMHDVDINNLYKDNYKSFTAWVNYFADNKAKVHVSLLWERLKAGRIYSEFEERAKAKGIYVKPLATAGIAPTTLVLASKIAGNNNEVADDLITKIADGTMTRSDLKNAWETVKFDRSSNGLAPTKKNGYDSKKNDISNEEKKEIKNMLSATGIVFALSGSGGSWIPNPIENEYKKSKYKLFTEFAVETGTSIHARRMDALVVETFSTQSKSYDLNLHGIEIKVDKSDLLNDHKMQEYTPFCDYFWIAIPEALEEDARSIMLDGWGLLLINSDTKEIKVAVEASKHEALFRMETLSTALLKSI